MSFTVTLHTLSKRDNSTKRPVASQGVSFYCILKSGSGIMHPTITLDLDIDFDPSVYNYAYIAEFERYYFIEEWYFENALWTASMKVDVLATYKNEIGESTLYIMRAADAYDGNIIDNLYPAKSGCSFASDIKSNPWDSDMCFIIGCVSTNANFGSLAYYAVTVGGLSTICTNLLDRDNIITEENGFSLDDASAALQLSLVDPIQYIKSCVALPVAIGDVTGSEAGVMVYNWSAGVGGKRLYLNPYITKTYTFDISKHPDTIARGNYVNSAPYTHITLTMPPFGTFDIDTSVTCNASSLTATVKLDPITGQASLTITCNGIVLNRVVSQLGIPISLSSVTRDYVGAASSAIGSVAGVVGSALTGNIAGAVGAAAGVGNAINSIMPRASTIGNTGSFATNQGNFRLDHQFFRPVADDRVHNGRPLCQMRKINTLSGYMIIQDGDVAINGTAAEDQAVRNYLESGFYYE